MDHHSNNHLKEISFNSNSKLRDKILGPSCRNANNKENEDLFKKLWSCCTSGNDHQEENDISHNMNKIEETEEGVTCGQWCNSRTSFSAQKNLERANSFWSATYETNNSIPIQGAPFFGSDDPPGRDTLLFKCREAIESLQEEIEELQKAINERDFLLSQSQEKEEQLISSKRSAFNEIAELKEKIQRLKEQMKENEDKYEQEWHKMLEENKQLKLQNIEQESKINKYRLKLESIEESVNDLKVKKSGLENSNEKLEGKLKDLKLTINEYESANQQLDTKLLWAEKTYEEDISKMMSEYEKKEQMIQKQNQDLLDKTQHERVAREDKIKNEMKDKILGIQKGIEASNDEIKKLRDDKQKLLEENMKLTQMISDVKLQESMSVSKNKSWECQNWSNNYSKSADQNIEYELKVKTKENESLKIKNKKLEKHFDGLIEQISEMKSEMGNLKLKKKDKMHKVKEEAEKYKDYFRSQIDVLRNEMISKKSNMDKMKQLLDHYKTKTLELEQELSESNQKWSIRWEEERKKWKIYLGQ